MPGSRTSSPRHATLRLSRFAPILLFALLLAASRTTPEAARGRSGSSDSWPPISAEEKALVRLPQDPEADAVILNSERVGKIVRKADDWVNVLSYHWRLKVLTEAGKRYGEVSIRALKYSRVSDIEARTVRPDGSAVPVAADQIFERVGDVGGVKYRETVFNFPAVEPGAILEYRYVRHDNFLGYIDPWYFDGPEFTLRSSVIQAMPGDRSYSALCTNCGSANVPKITPWREEKLRGQQVSLELRDLPRYREEIMMPPRNDASPHLEMVLTEWRRVYSEALGRQDRLFIDWESVANYAAYYYGEAIKGGQPAIRPLAQEWTAGMQDPKQKVAAILRHVQTDFRYVSYVRASGWSRSIEAILKEKSADNEEKAVLMVAALQAVGIEAYVALVAGKDSGDLNPNFNSLSQFSHAIVALPRADGGYDWMDPTVACIPAGFVPYKDSGASALLIRKGTKEPMTLPSRNELNTTRYAVTLRPRPDGRADIELQARFQGEDAADMREDLVGAAADAQLRALQNWVTEMRPGAAVKSHTIEELDDYSKPLTIGLAIEAPGLVTIAGPMMLVRACVFSCIEASPISGGERTHPFYVDRGWNEEETVTVEPPAGFAAAEMPPASAQDSPGTRMSLTCSEMGGGGARCVRRFMAQRNRYQAAAAPAFRKLFDGAVTIDQTRVAFRAAGGPG